MMTKNFERVLYEYSRSNCHVCVNTKYDIDRIQIGIKCQVSQTDALSILF